MGDTSSRAAPSSSSGTPAVATSLAPSVLAGCCYADGDAARLECVNAQSGLQIVEAPRVSCGLEVAEVEEYLPDAFEAAGLPITTFSRKTSSISVEEEDAMIHEIEVLKGQIIMMEEAQEANLVARMTQERNLQGHGSKLSRPDETHDTMDTDVKGMLEDADEEEEEDQIMSPRREPRRGPTFDSDISAHANIGIVMGSAMAMSKIRQAIIYGVALAGVAFVLLARSYDIGSEWGGEMKYGAGNKPVIVNIAYCLAGAGVLAFLVNLASLPLLLGYLLGGCLVGPLALNIVNKAEDIGDMSNLGLVFLLFMIGLELDVSELLKMGKVVLLTGLLQFPLCMIIMTLIFHALSMVGISFGEGQYSTLYCGMTCGISSTMIVVKLLQEHADMDSSPGRLTVGILIFQDIWAIVILAVQPDLANPQVLGLLKTFGMIIGLIVIALAYAKFVMPAVFLVSSSSVELMLIIALAWCFFMCCLASLPFIGLSMELAALISGVALATFPYSAEFNGKIKYIRDMFIILFFVGLGMQIPQPSFAVLGTALIVAIVVMAVRWVGIFFVVCFLGGGTRLAAISTINLSQISEFALVICTLGANYGHVGKDTLELLIWTFSLLAILSSYLIGFNYKIYGLLSRCARFLLRRPTNHHGNDTEDEGEDHVDRNIVILGFHRVAAMLISHLEHHSRHILDKVHVIDSHEDIMPELRNKGVTCAYGDISSADVVEHAYHGEARLVICSTPDAMLKGVTNRQLLQICKQVFPHADVIVTADTPQQAQMLYHHGADYVVRMSKLSAERIHELISDHATHVVHHHHLGEALDLAHIFEAFKTRDLDHGTHIHVK